MVKSTFLFLKYHYLEKIYLIFKNLKLLCVMNLKFMQLLYKSMVKFRFMYNVLGKQLNFNKICNLILWSIKIIISRGSFINQVVKILGIFDSPPPFVVAFTK